MRFTRSDIGDVTVGKPSGERVKIEEIADRSLPLVYGSELAEERIKHEIREADENVYKKGFIVDVNVKSTGGRPSRTRSRTFIRSSICPIEPPPRCQLS